MGAAALAPLCVDLALRGIIPRATRQIFMHRHRKRSKCLRKWTSVFDPKSSQAPLGRPRFARCPKWSHGVPREPKGGQSDAKESPLGAQGDPKDPKGSPKSPQGKQNELQGHPKETNKSQNYIHINKTPANSRSTAIQRPFSLYFLHPGPKLQWGKGGEVG